MRNTPSSKLSEFRIAQAYIRLLLSSDGKDGNKMASLARVGDYEVRLIEFSQAGSADAPPMWMELYAHHLKLSIDSCSCHEIEEAAGAAEYLFSQAECMHELRNAKEAKCNAE